MFRLIRELITTKIKQLRQKNGAPLSTTSCHKELSVQLTMPGFSPFSPTPLISLRSPQRDPGITRRARRPDWLLSLMAQIRYRRFESRSGIKRPGCSYQLHSDASFSATASVLVLKPCVKPATSQNNEKLLHTRLL